MTRSTIVPDGPGPHLDLPQEEDRTPHRGESNSRQSSSSAREFVRAAAPSDLELEVIDFALNNKETPTGIVEQSRDGKTVRVEFQDMDGERIIKRVGVTRGVER